MAVITLDNMEYGSDAAAQVAYQSNYPIAVGEIEILLVAGGGGGGQRVGGGGGGGGLVYNSEYRVAAIEYNVVVGAGGSPATANGTRGSSGGNSSFDMLNAIGGGGGDSYPTTGRGGNGGSGGGGAFGSGVGGDADYLSPRQGYDGGGTYTGGAQYGGGGGGGGGAVGSTAASTKAGDGGIGASYTIRDGSAVYYSGGGGGGASGGSSGVGGSGGGGDGKAGSGINGEDADANTGGGGGGGSDWSSSGGSGGTGIVIISYVTGDISATGGTVTTNGSKTVHTFTTNGVFSVSSGGSQEGYSAFSEHTAIFGGSYSLKCVATQTTSLNKTLARTIAAPINLTGHAYIIGKIRASRTGSNIKIGFHDSGGTTTEVTPNIATADTWQTITLDISAVSDANKDAIDSIIITITNADAENTFYLDNLFATTELNMQVSKAVAYAVLTPIKNALSVSKAVAYVVLGPFVDSGPMMWIF